MTADLVMLDLKRNRADRQAAMLIEELYRAGYLAEQCTGDARGHLAHLFYRLDVEITTGEERKIEIIMRSHHAQEI